MDHQHDGFVTSPACSVFLFIDSLLCQWKHHLWFTESIEETGVITFTTSSHAWSFGVSGVLWVCFLFFGHYCLDCAFCHFPVVLVSLAEDTITSCCWTVWGYPYPTLHVYGQFVDVMCFSSRRSSVTQWSVWL